MSKHYIKFRNLNKKFIENNQLINQIMAIKDEYVAKMNEINEMQEDAKKKKEVYKNSIILIRQQTFTLKIKKQNIRKAKKMKQIFWKQLKITTLLLKMLKYPLR